VAAATLESIMDFRLTEPEIRGIDFMVWVTCFPN